jgi:hypothetical protein
MSDMVENIIKVIDLAILFMAAHASCGKVIRAEIVSSPNE